MSFDVRGTSDTDRKFNVLAPLANAHELKSTPQDIELAEINQRYGQPLRSTRLLSEREQLARERPERSRAQ